MRPQRSRTAIRASARSSVVPAPRLRSAGSTKISSMYSEGRPMKVEYVRKYTAIPIGRVPRRQIRVLK